MSYSVINSWHFSTYTWLFRHSPEIFSYINLKPNSVVCLCSMIAYFCDWFPYMLKLYDFLILLHLMRLIFNHPPTIAFASSKLCQEKLEASLITGDGDVFSLNGVILTTWKINDVIAAVGFTPLSNERFKIFYPPPYAPILSHINLAHYISYPPI